MSPKFLSLGLAPANWEIATRPVTHSYGCCSSKLRVTHSHSHEVCIWRLISCHFFFCIWSHVQYVASYPVLILVEGTKPLYQAFFQVWPVDSHTRTLRHMYEHTKHSGLISVVTVRLAFRCGSLHSCRLPKQTPVSCPSVSCCVSPPMYPLWQKPVWGRGRVTHTHTHAQQECCRHFKTICLCPSWGSDCQTATVPLLLSWPPLCQHLSCSSFHSWPADKKNTHAVHGHSSLHVFKPARGTLQRCHQKRERNLLIHSFPFRLWVTFGWNNCGATTKTFGICWALKVHS